MNITMTSRHCQATHRCQQPPCFQARLEAPGNRHPVHRTAELCAEHLGDVVHDLTTWAHGSGITQGHVTVLIIDAGPGQLVTAASEDEPHTPGVPFGTISLSQ